LLTILIQGPKQPVIDIDVFLEPLLEEMEKFRKHGVLAERVAQVFYIADPMNVKKHIAVSGKQRILGVEGVIDVEEYNQFEELVLFKDHEKRIKKFKPAFLNR
jgi:hypothetical protein